MGTHLWPNLGYRDAPAAIRFLVEAFGFEKGIVHEVPGAGTIAHAELHWPDGGGIMLHTAGSEVASVAGMSAVAAGDAYPAFSMHIDTDDPDALFARVTAAGVPIVRELADSPHGTRGFIARPGNRVVRRAGHLESSARV